MVTLNVIRPRLLRLGATSRRPTRVGMSISLEISQWLHAFQKYNLSKNPLLEQSTKKPSNASETSHGINIRKKAKPRIKQGRGEESSVPVSKKNGDFAHLEPKRFFGGPPVIARQTTVFRKPSRESTDDLLWVGDREVVSASLDRDEFGGWDECLDAWGVFVRHRFVRSSLYVV